MLRIQSEVFFFLTLAVLTVYLTSNIYNFGVKSFVQFSFLKNERKNNTTCTCFCVFKYSVRVQKDENETVLVFY